MNNWYKRKAIDTFWYYISISILLFSVFLYNLVAETWSIPYAKMADELIVGSLLVCSALVLLSGKKIFLYLEEKIILTLVLGLIFIGLVSSVVNRYQGISPVIMDLVIFLKPFGVYFSARILLQNFNLECFYKKHKKILTTTLFILVALVSIQYILEVFPWHGERHGIMTLKLYFTHPSRFAYAVAFIFILLYPFLIRSSSGRAILLLILCIGLLSTRYKYYGFVAVAIFSLFYLRNQKIIKVSNYFMPVLVLVAIVVFISYEQISFYFSPKAYELGYARVVLSVTSAFIANDHFPLGGGFSTFASHYSDVYYSPLYEKYNISTVYGLSENAPVSLIADAFWAMILGQFGYIGFVMYTLVFALYLRLFIGFFNKLGPSFVKDFVFSGILVLVLLIVESSSDSTITQSRGIAAFLLLAVVVSTARASMACFRMNDHQSQSQSI